MERRISEIYGRASKEVEKKTKDFFDAFDKKDKAMQKKLAEGAITESKYKEWRKAQLMTGQHWEEMKKSVSSEMLKARQTATAYVNGRLPEVYALNYNAVGDIVKGYSFELVDAATVRHLATSDKTLLPYKEVNGKKEVRWNTQRVNAEVLQGIIQGESIPKIAKRMAQNVGMTARGSAVRNARTAVTGAENKGRMDSYIEAEAMGIVLKKQWLATHDARTRDAHLELDGVEVDINEHFHNGIGKIMFPGDPNAAPGNVYNCRCTLISNVVGFINPETGKINYIEQAGKKNEEKSRSKNRVKR